MALFGKSGHDDGYVSPFDAEHSQDYVNPDKQASVISAQEMAEPTRSQEAAAESASYARPQSDRPRSDRPQSDGASKTSKAAYHGASQPRSASASATRRPAPQSSPQRPSGGKLPTDVRQIERRYGKPNKSNRISHVIGWLVAIAIFVSGIVSGYVKGTVSNDGSPTISTFSSGKPKEIKDGSGDVELYSGRKATITIEKAAAGIADYETHKPTVIITYQMKNTGTDTVTFSDFRDIFSAFQNGVALREVSLYNGDKPVEGYDRKSLTVKVAPGKSQVVTDAFELRDLTTPLYVQPVKADRTHIGIASGFTIADGGKTFTRISHTDVPKPQTVPESDTAHMTTFHTYGDDVQVKVSKVVRGPDTKYDNAHTVLVYVDWVNRGTSVTSFGAAVNLKLTQNGKELESTYLLDGNEPEGFDNYGYARALMPNVGGTYTAAFKLPDPNAPVTVTLDGGTNPNAEEGSDERHNIVTKEYTLD